MKKNILICLLSGVFIAGIIAGCKKNNLVVDKEVIPPAFAKFLTITPLRFDVTSTHTNLKIPVSITNVSTADRTITISASSPSGAQTGTQFTFSTSVVIPAGKVIDSLPVSAIFSAYQTGRKDTIIFTIVDGDVKASDYNNKFTLYLYGPCYEGNVVLSNLLGAYTHTNETWFGPYGPYTTTISAVNQLTPTTGTITVNNIFDFGWNPIMFTLDWTDPNNRTVTVISQSSGIADASTLDPSYAGEEVAVQPFAGQSGTFSACNSTVTLKMQVGVAGLGFFSPLYTVAMTR